MLSFVHLCGRNFIPRFLPFQPKKKRTGMLRSRIIMARSPQHIYSRHQTRGMKNNKSA